jgi:peptide/nickel transport system ATP-binding protein
LDVLLEARNLRKYFPIKKSFRQLFKSGAEQQQQQHLVVKAVDNVSFVLERGKVLVIAGASGSGKTTVAK